MQRSSARLLRLAALQAAAAQQAGQQGMASAQARGAPAMLGMHQAWQRPWASGLHVGSQVRREHSSDSPASLSSGQVKMHMQHSIATGMDGGHHTGGHDTLGDKGGQQQEDGNVAYAPPRPGSSGGMWLALIAATLFGAVLGWLSRDVQHHHAATMASFEDEDGDDGGRAPGTAAAPFALPFGLPYALPDMPPSLKALAHYANSGWAALKEAATPLQSWMLASFIQSGIVAKFAAVFVATIPLIVMLGGVYRLVARTTWSTSMYRVYALLYRSPVVEGTAASSLVANVAFLAGFFTFAMTISLATEEVNRRFEAIHSGALPVAAEDHVLILNWNSQALAIMRQIAAAQAADAAAGVSNGPWDRPVVVLADRRKKEMDELIKESLWSKGYQLEVHTRTGVPFKLSDLERVSADKAATVILLHPEEVELKGSEEAMKVATAMSLTAVNRGAPQRIVVQQPEEVGAGEGMLSSLAAINGGGAALPSAVPRYSVLQLPERKFMHRLVAHAAAQPGMLSVWQDILSPEGGTAQMRTLELVPELAGKAFAVARRSYNQLIICGYMSPSGRVCINPADSEAVPPGSRLICLAPSTAALSSEPSTEALALHALAAQAAEMRMRPRRRSAWWGGGGSGVGECEQPRSIIVAGWPREHIQDLQEGFLNFTPVGSHITFITSEPLPKHLPHRCAGRSFTYLTAAQPTGAKALCQAGIGSADTVVLGDSRLLQATGSWESDAQTLAGLLQVQEAVHMSGRSGPPPHVLAPLTKWASGKVATQFLSVLQSEAEAAEAAARLPPGRPQPLWLATRPPPPVLRAPEFLLPDDLSAALLTQVAAEPAYGSLIKELLWASEGHELYLRDPSAFGIVPGMPSTFAELAEAVRSCKQTALGYLRSSDGACVLAPPAEEQIIWQPGDRIVVVAEEY